MNYTGELTQFGASPEVVADIIRLLGIDPAELTLSQNFDKVKEIVSFFKDSNYETKILSIIGRAHGTDRLEAVHAYTSLQNMKRQEMEKLDPNEFIGVFKDKLIKEKYLGVDDLKNIRTDVEGRIAAGDQGLVGMKQTLSNIDQINKALSRYE